MFIWVFIIVRFIGIGPEKPQRGEANYVYIFYNRLERLEILEMLGSVIRLIFKTSSVTPDFFYVYNLILSSSTCSQSFKKNLYVGTFGRERPWAIGKKKPEKIRASNGIRTRDLRDAGAMLYQPSYEATNWEQVHKITVSEDKFCKLW